MRTDRRFRPGTEFLMARITPSDITTIIYLTGPSPVDPPAPADPYGDVQIPTWTGPSETPNPSLTLSPPCSTSPATTP